MVRNSLTRTETTRPGHLSDDYDYLQEFRELVRKNRCCSSILGCSFRGIQKLRLLEFSGFFLSHAASERLNCSLVPHGVVRPNERVRWPTGAARKKNAVPLPPNVPAHERPPWQNAFEDGRQRVLFVPNFVENYIRKTKISREFHYRRFFFREESEEKHAFPLYIFFRTFCSVSSEFQNDYLVMLIVSVRLSHHIFRTIS